ncbi:glycosyltransferase [Mangrovimonas sp. AS39]|uniref:glycosyltransferase family 2 protein n=1 Tax=Mangrovimonas futianensis TaxID=2895523 RepID=UPI001E383242|nr:glycosyltransferase family 2 protein [Mangrovimonas futianensis]MCF1190803.1 glycosyltransferase [Mangrovimonas futianensis]MCF1194500.1 glycosyltransferase [Mangrovimonas futianensis]
MNDIPKVSILTTMYNREKYISACIQSVLASTFQDWELIIVDDQSKDRSVEIARTYEAKDARIKVYVNEKNLGDYPNRNQAASYAKGKYIKYLDADDLIYPHGLEIMVKTMEQFPEAVLGISQEVAEDYKSYPFLMTPHETFEREFLKRGVLNFGPTATIFRRKEFEELGKFTGTRYIGDTEMWYKMALKYPVVKIVPGLTFWRQHDDQEITKGTENYFYLENTYKHGCQTLNDPSMPLSLSEISQAKLKLNKRFARSIWRMMIFKREFSKATKIMKSCNFSLFKLYKAFL